MIYINGADIYIPRGESASFDIVWGDTLPQEASDNVLWLKSDTTPEDGTPIRFSVKTDVDKLFPIIEKDYVVNNGFVTIPIESKDTNWLPFGAYVWDVRFMFPDAGEFDINTPIAKHLFYITEVVGNV